MRAPKFIRDCFTEDDAGEIWSLVHALGALVILSGLGLQFYDVVWLHHAFDMQTFGLGSVGMFGGVTAAIYGNSKSGTKHDP